MNAWKCIACTLLFAGCFSPQHHGPRDDSSDGGTEAATNDNGTDGATHAHAEASGLLSESLWLTVKTERQIINTQRLRTLVAEPGACVRLSTLVETGLLESYDSQPNDPVLWQSDASLCKYAYQVNGGWGNAAEGAATIEVPVPYYEQASVAVIGYDAENSKPSFFGCVNMATTHELQLRPSPGEGFDPNEADRWSTFSTRCEAELR